MKIEMKKISLLQSHQYSVYPFVRHVPVRVNVWSQLDCAEGCLGGWYFQRIFVSQQTERREHNMADFIHLAGVQVK